MFGDNKTIGGVQGLRAWQHALIFLVACAIGISRQLDAIFHAQFWAEAGHVFYSEAYNLGWWPPLFRTLTGYYQTLPRLCAAIALLVPLSRAPLVMNLVAIAVQALPANILLSERSSAWGSFRFRIMMVLIYLGLPNDLEIHWIVNTQWHLALCSLLLIVASSPSNWLQRYFDLAVILLSGLTGPFCFPLLPISIFIALKRRAAWNWLPVAAISLSCAVQAWALTVIDPVARAHRELGASASTLARILGCEIYLGTLLGENMISTIPGTGFTLFLAIVAVLGTAVILTCFLKSNWEMRLFLFFAGALLAASLMSPAGAIPAGSTPWRELMQEPGHRYWYLPTLALAWSLLWFRSQPKPILRKTATVLLCIMVFGIVRDWRNPAVADQTFHAYARQFDEAPAGTTITIPIHPQGWNMKLIKHPGN